MVEDQSYSLHSPGEVASGLAASCRDLRLARGWKQTTLAQRSGVTLASLRRFEQSGRISLRNLLRLGSALGRLDDFTGVFLTPAARSIAELEMRETNAQRKRGHA